MGKWATGREAWGECQKTGRRMLLNEMVRDGYYKVLVDPNAYDPPEPRERPIAVTDAIALFRPAPDLDAGNQVTVITFPRWDMFTNQLIGGLTEVDQIGNQEIEEQFPPRIFWANDVLIDTLRQVNIL